jgi:two-component system phosphate regulon sensor histidine kinase PhoR
VEFFVEDQGPGIPKEAQSRVFERFFRVDVSRSREAGGTGLGLAIVKHLVEKMNGEVSLKSEEGKGSIFVVALSAVN